VLALLSVSDKRGLVPFARGLVRRGFRLLSTGGTLAALQAAGVPATQVS
jgi:phosphoribosylaminoimidazolecarboxamide formyltransferase/IMP cyclohydrolase